MNVKDHYQLDRSLAPLGDALAKLEREQVIARFWQKDPTLFTGKTLMLDWLSVPKIELKALSKLDAIKEKALKKQCRSIVLLGMGGSSLAPRVFHDCLKTSSLPFYIFDTIHPDALYRLEQQIDIKSTLFVVASKSGSTLEPNLLYQHFLSQLLEAKVLDPFAHFMAITDPISPLEQIAAENGFLQGIFGEPLIGGRYSALSAFGIMPALLMGIDARALLESALSMSKRCEPLIPINENPGALLGAFLGINALHDRAMIKFFFSKSLKPLGGWLEQLLAESLGKQNKGIVPIVNDDPDLLDTASAMHCFIELEDEFGYESHKKALKERGASFVSLALLDRFELGAQMFQWEVGVSLAGSIIGVNPFDQPDVEKSKDRARSIMDSWDSEKLKSLSLPQSEALATFQAMIKGARVSCYCAILSYLDENDITMALLHELAHAVSSAVTKPVLVQSGPRYLHSTGQLFKGGANTGCFLILTGPYAHNFPSELKNLSFKDIHLSQALGDFEAMTYAQRKLWRIDLRDTEAQIKEFIESL